MQFVPDYTHRNLIRTHKKDRVAAWAHSMHMDTAVVVDELDEEATSQVVPHSNLAHNNASPMLE